MTMQAKDRQTAERILELEIALARYEQEKQDLLSRQSLFDSLYENISLGITVWDQQGVLQYVNKGFSDLTGYAAEEIRFRKDWLKAAYPDPEYRSRVIAEWNEPLNVIREFKITCKNGETKEIEFRRKFLPDGMAIVTLADITARKRAEETLKESERRYRTMWENTGTATLIMQEDTTIRMVNSGYEKLSGLDRKEIEGKMSWTEHVVPEDLEKMKRYHVERRREDGVAPRSYEFGFIGSDGVVKHVLNTVSIIPGTTDSIASLIDISERKHAEKRLRESEEFYTRLVATMPDIVVRVDLEGTILFVNDVVQQVSGYRKDEVTGENMLTFVVPEDHELVINNTLSMFDEHLGPRSYQMIMKDGARRTFEVNGDILRNADGSPYGLVHILRDITERDRAQKALRESEERYRTVLETSPDPIAAYDMHGNITYLNPAFTRVFGWSLEEMRHKRTGYTPETEISASRRMLEKVKRGESFSGFETRRLTKDGAVLDISMSAAVLRNDKDEPAGSVITLRDITGQKRLEKQLIQAHKMEALGTLAGGIAHDFNNILSAVIGYSEISLSETAPGSLVNGNLRKILKAGMRAKDLVRQILTFSRQSDQEMIPVQVTPIVAEVLKFLRASLPTTIQILQKGSSDATVLADPTQIHQILMNLCANAAHAMEDAGGTLTLTLQEVEHPMSYEHQDAFSSASEADQVPGIYLEIGVSDTGTGIRPEILNRIFDPFFTTKKPGKGTGMGLSVVHGIVKSHGGKISVSSQVGEGTTFTVLLPVAQNPAPEKAAAVDPIPMGNERILFIDDEPFQLDIGRQVLNKLGYHVETCDDGIESLQLFSAHPDHYDLVITDMTMPEMTGDRLAARIKEVRPDIPVILCTGFSEKVTEENLASLRIDAMLLKPVVFRELAKTVRQVLDKNRSRQDR